MYTAWFHPATWIALIVLFGVMMLIPMGSILYDLPHKRNPEFRPSESFSVVESKVHYGIEKDIPHVSCIGTIRNNTGTAWEDLHFQVRFFNSAGQLVDTLSDSDYSLVVQPHSEMTFRVRGLADKSADQYVTHKIQVIWAKEAHASW
ncbi:MAG TPA: hypothetical protein VNZ64_16235 [Candidatus Acidoferrum sp.]|jgi:hypothetical protein|nr:hypothetical protein [Candidatus Acidoferrum sp.]